LPYIRQPELLTRAERDFFAVLQSAAPSGWHIFPQVRLANLVTLHSRNTLRHPLNLPWHEIGEQLGNLVGRRRKGGHTQSARSVRRSGANVHLARVAVVSVTALNGERFRLRDPGDIRRFLTAVGRSPDEVPS
jgi:hypothetical protein